MAKTTMYTTYDIRLLISIGFCQPKFYKRSAWLKAKKLMDNVVCKNDLAEPYDYGRGKGKYTSKLDIPVVITKTIELIKGLGLLQTHENEFVIFNDISNEPAKTKIQIEPQRLATIEVRNYSGFTNLKESVNVYGQNEITLQEGLSWISFDDFLLKNYVIGYKQ